MREGVKERATGREERRRVVPEAAPEERATKAITTSILLLVARMTLKGTAKVLFNVRQELR